MTAIVGGRCVTAVPDPVDSLVLFDGPPVLPVPPESDVPPEEPVVPDTE